MSIHNELYDVVKRLQKDFPDLLTLIPINTFYSDDMYEVMKSLLETSQQKLDSLEQDMLCCYKCDQVIIDPCYCGECQNFAERTLTQAHMEISRLRQELENE